MQSLNAIFECGCQREVTVLQDSKEGAPFVCLFYASVRGTKFESSARREAPLLESRCGIALRRESAHLSDSLVVAHVVAVLESLLNVLFCVFPPFSPSLLG